MADKDVRASKEGRASFFRKIFYPGAGGGLDSEILQQIPTLNERQRLITAREIQGTYEEWNEIKAQVERTRKEILRKKGIPVEDSNAME